MPKLGQFGLSNISVGMNLKKFNFFENLLVQSTCLRDRKTALTDFFAILGYKKSFLKLSKNIQMNFEFHP